MPGRRVHQRFEIEIPVVLVHPERETAGVTRNMSLGGMYIATDHMFAYGTELTLRLPLPALKGEASIPGVVRWHGPDGVGVQFGSLRAKEVWALNQLFRNATPQPEPE